MCVVFEVVGSGVECHPAHQHLAGPEANRPGALVALQWWNMLYEYDREINYVTHQDRSEGPVQALQRCLVEPANGIGALLPVLGHNDGLAMGQHLRGTTRR